MAPCEAVARHTGDHPGAAWPGQVSSVARKKHQRPQRTTNPAGSRRRARRPDAAGEARRQAALAELGELALDTEAAEPLLEAACALVRQALACDAAAVGERRAEELVLRASSGLLPERREARLVLDARGRAGTHAHHLSALGLAAGREVQLPGRLRPQLVLGAYHRSARPLGPAALTFLEGAARLLAAALSRQRAERDLVDRERLLLAAFEARPEPELLVDEAGVIREANAAACQLLGHPRRSVVGRGLRSGGDVSPGATGAELGLGLGESPPPALTIASVAAIAPGVRSVRLQPGGAEVAAAPITIGEAAPAARPTAGLEARARILVVDDEPLVGTALARTLGDEHDVTVVSGAAAALARIDGGERFDAILSDLLMPGMSGIELYRALARVHPAQARRIAFLTGAAFEAETRALLRAESIPWLEKPFDLSALRALVAGRIAG